jgi:hypothetical protein
MTVTLDQIDTPARWQPQRDRWGRPLIVPPGGGRPVGYTRTTTVAKTLDDEGALTKWAQRMTAAGLVRRPDLLALIASKLTPGGDIPEGAKNDVNDLCDQAKEAAAASAAANMGTALHAMTELADAGAPLANIPPALAPDLAAYRLATGALEHLAIENFVVLDDWKVAGTFDRLVRMPDGRTLIADLKTGQDLSYSWRSISVQLAIYAHGVLYDDGRRTPLPADVDLSTALVIHLPVGKATCTLHELDIAAGWEAFEHSMLAREWRQRRDLARPIQLSSPPATLAPESDAPPAPVVSTAPVHDRAEGGAPGAATLTARAARLRDVDGASAWLAARWPDGVPGVSKITDPAHVEAVTRLIGQAEAQFAVPFAPDLDATRETPSNTMPVGGDKPPAAVWQRPDDGGPADPAAIEVLRRNAGNLPKDLQALMSAWGAQALRAGRDIVTGDGHTVRSFEVLRAIVNAAMVLADKWGHDDELLRLHLAAALGDEAVTQPSIEVGAAFASLSIDEARALAAAFEHAYDAGSAVGFDNDGRPVLVDAVRAAN